MGKGIDNNILKDMCKQDCDALCVPTTGFTHSNPNWATLQKDVYYEDIVTVNGGATVANLDLQGGNGWETITQINDTQVKISGTPDADIYLGTHSIVVTAIDCGGPLYQGEYDVTVYEGPNMTAGGDFDNGNMSSGGTDTGTLRINNIGDMNSYGNITAIITHALYGTTTFTPPAGVTITDNLDGTSTLVTTNVVPFGLANALLIPLSYTNDGIHGGSVGIQVDINDGSGGETDVSDNQAGFNITVAAP